MTAPTSPEVRKQADDEGQTNSISPISEFFSRWGKLLLVAGLALLAVLAYVGVTAAVDNAGYPLDDSWIHLTYARNLARSGRWEFIPGIVSAGSTAPLWTVLLSAGYLFGLPYLFWTTFLGWFCLSWTGWAAMRLWGVLWPSRSSLDWVIGVVLVLSWPLVWAAGSAMETLLFIAHDQEVLYLYGLHITGKGKSLVGLGLVAGLLVLTRPEGLGLLVLVAAGILVAGDIWKTRIKEIGRLLIGAAIPMIPYFAFNLWVSGSIWPNTFYAKQVEYASLYTQPFVLRFARLLFLSLGGISDGWRGISAAHLVLLPGLIVALINAFKRDRQQKVLLRSLPIFWAVGLVLVYAWRLPVTYQHGRYLFPTIPIWIMYGLGGWLDIFGGLSKRIGSRHRIYFVLSRMAALVFVVLLLVFLILGMQVFVQDVSFVNGEMVTIGNWLNENTTADALIAAHDIGAIGYFAERPILDLAGLISPEVIPLLSDRNALLDYVSDSESDYIVTAPGWTYDSLTASDKTILKFSTEYAWTREQGVNNMEIYLLVR
jgi:hypothetical protein